MIKFIRITKANVLTHWHLWAKDLEELCGDKYSTGNETMENYLNMLIHPQSNAIFWAGFNEGRYEGFMVTLPDGEHLLIHSVKARSGHARELFDYCLSTIEKYAKKEGYKKVKFVTKREPAFYKKMKSLGYAPEQAIFYKEV